MDEEVAAQADRIRALEDRVSQLGEDLRAARIRADAANLRADWAESMLRRVQSLAQLGHWMFDLETQKFEWSDQVFALFGRNPGDGPPTLEVCKTAFDPAELAELEALAKELLRTSEPVELTHRILLPDGDVRWSFTTAQLDAERGKKRIVGTAQDVTDQRQLEIKLQQATKMEAVGRLAGGVAHDFNNMLTAIVSFTQFALENAGADSPLAADLQEVLAAAERASDITGRLLAFSRRKTVAPRVLSIDEVVDNLARLLQRVIGEDVQFQLELNSGTALTRIDPGALEQILVNLTVNSRDAMPHGGRLSIRTGRTKSDGGVDALNRDIAPGDYVTIRVEDTGSGIEPELLAKIFDPFFTTKAHGAGTGLGLSMCYGFVEQAGGFVNVESTVGSGSCFEILLPRAPSEQPRSDPGERRSPGGGPERVLVVEDDEVVREIAARVLARVGYTAVTAATPNEALAHAAREERFDLFLIDVVMPQMNGYELSHLLHERHPRAATLFMSGYFDESLMGLGVLDEGLHLLQKPFTPDRLKKLVREALDGQLTPGVY